jgi:hypothetical protein
MIAFIGYSSKKWQSAVTPMGGGKPDVAGIKADFSKPDNRKIVG